jgi:hypothetical protein
VGEIDESEWRRLGIKETQFSSLRDNIIKHNGR